MAGEEGFLEDGAKLRLFHKWNAEDQAAAALDLRELGAELCKTQVLHPELFSGKGDRAIQSVSELVKSIINTILSDRNEPLHCGVGRDD
jgi:hypothetical protein